MKVVSGPSARTFPEDVADARTHELEKKHVVPRDHEHLYKKQEREIGGRKAGAD